MEDLKEVVLKVKLGIAKNLKALRERKNLSIKQLAAMTGFSEKTLKAWESGKTNPKVKNILKLANFYNVLPSKIFGF